MNKNNTFTCLIFLLITMQGLAQQSTNAAGGEATGLGGNLSFSVGQPFTQIVANSGGTVAQGVQHAFEIYNLSIQPINNEFSLHIYPNPCSNFLHIGIPSVGLQMEYQLLDLNGKILSSKPINSTTTSINMTSYSAGTYIVRVFKGSNSIKTLKIIKT